MGFLAVFRDLADYFSGDCLGEYRFEMRIDLGICDGSQLRRFQEPGVYAFEADSHSPHLLPCPKRSRAPTPHGVGNPPDFIFRTPRY